MVIYLLVVVQDVFILTLLRQIVRAKREVRGATEKSTLMTKLYRDRCRALIGCLRVLHFSRASNNQSTTLQGSL